MSIVKRTSRRLHPGHALAIFFSILMLPFLFNQFNYLLASPATRLQIKENIIAQTPPIAYANNTNGEVPFDVYIKPPILIHGCHLLPALFWCLIFPIQFSTRIRLKYLVVHRWLGRIGLGMPLLLGISGIGITLVKAAYVVERHLPHQTYFRLEYINYVLGARMLVCIYHTYQSARAKQFYTHRTWAVRMAATGYAVVVMRIFILFYTIWSEVFQYDHRGDINTKELFFGWSAWVATLLSLSVVELYLWHYGPGTVITNKSA
ncbi:hypothetical protein BZG36_00621 [Bifiguratus adelaidae]|uniref:Uncharacterized protein n=1 Tax=Bifiguratus adelaidae TaxID=1938954 RepID=A0A261Y7J3_9FUNG|nr:hypothetical protein BZG36_00621 [Bifiguratus adelaidae]